MQTQPQLDVTVGMSQGVRHDFRRHEFQVVRHGFQLPALQAVSDELAGGFDAVQIVPLDLHAAGSVLWSCAGAEGEQEGNVISAFRGRAPWT